MVVILLRYTNGNGTQNLARYWKLIVDKKDYCCGTSKTLSLVPVDGKNWDFFAKPQTGDYLDYQNYQDIGQTLSLGVQSFRLPSDAMWSCLMVDSFFGYLFRQQPGNLDNISL